ncbi:unnamed protein product [Caenorhabditis sp. 36 PRJEB53466]|nr:unnamed protein product [Caenorhabditis sp. 36 PRJEB53466]
MSYAGMMPSSKNTVQQAEDEEKQIGKSNIIREDENGVSTTTPPLKTPFRMTPMVAALIASKCEAEARKES